MKRDDDRRQPWIKWYPADWRADPRLRICSYAARGLWADMIALMHESSPYGHLLIAGMAPTPKQIASVLGGSEREVKALLIELQQAGVFSLTDDDVIYSRRMVRDKAKAERDISRGNNGGNPDLLRGSVPKADRVRPYKRSDAPQKTMRIFEACGGHCHWCDVQLEFDAFHVDHLLAIRDGGGHEESNLVASCAACNHLRARQEIPTSRSCSCRKWLRHQSDNNSDHKAQKLEARCQTSESKASGADAPPDPIKELFDTGVKILTNLGVAPKSARSLIGQCRKEFGAVGPVFDLLLKIERDRIQEPCAYIEAAIREHKTPKAANLGRAWA